MLEGSFDIAPAVRDLAIELDVLRRRVRLLEDAVAALSKPEAPEPAGRKGGKREKAVTDDAADAG